MAKNKQKGKAIQFQIGWAGLVAIVVSCVCVLLWTFVLGFWMGQKVVTGNAREPKVSVYSPTAKAPQTGSVAIHGGQVQDNMPLVTEEYEAAKKEFSDIKESLKEEASEEGIKTEVMPGAAPESAEKGVATEGAEAKEEEKPATSVKEAVKEEVKESKVEKTPQKKKEKEAKKPIEKPKIAKKVKTEKIARPAKEASKPFALQIASYRTLAQAKKEAQRWRKKGYFVRVRSANLGRKGIWYRVYLGRYSSLERAKRASIKLATKEGIRSYVTKVSK